MSTGTQLIQTINFMKIEGIYRFDFCHWKKIRHYFCLRVYMNEEQIMVAVYFFHTGLESKYVCLKKKKKKNKANLRIW